MVQPLALCPTSHLGINVAWCDDVYPYLWCKFFESTLANVVIALLAVMYAVGAPMTSKPAID